MGIFDFFKRKSTPPPQEEDYSIHTHKNRTIPNKLRPENTLEYKLMYYAKYASVRNTAAYLERFGFQKQDIADRITEYIKKGYLKLASDSDKLEQLKSDDLKKILRAHSLGVSGKKADLLQRIQVHVPDEIIKTYIPKEDMLLRTESGNSFYKSLFLQRQENHDNNFERMTDSVAAHDIKSAENIAKMAESHNILGGAFRIDFEENAALRKIAQEYPGRYGYALIANMISGQNNKRGLIKAYSQSYGVEIRDVNEAVIHNDIMYAYALRSLEQYRSAHIQYYEILASMDDRTCDRCKQMHRKRFKIAEAEKGVNFPPFCDYCRCTILAVMDDIALQK